MEEKNKIFSNESGKRLFEILIIILVIAGIWFALSELPNKKKERELQKKITNSPIPVIVKKGELAEGFPEEILLNEKIEIIESNSFKNTTGEIIEAAVAYKSQSKLENNKNFYEDWANKNKWQISYDNNSKNENNSVNLLFGKENKSIIILIETKEYGADVSIFYKKIDLKESGEKLRDSFKNFKI